MQVIKIRLSTDEERECNYHSEEEMFAETEANGEKLSSGGHALILT